MTRCSFIYAIHMLVISFSNVICNLIFLRRSRVLKTDWGRAVLERAAGRVLESAAVRHYNIHT